MRLVVASKNQDKARELSELLSGLSVAVMPLSDYPDAPDIIEDGETFRGNARKKAIGIARFTGLHSVADDSGLCVDALGGRPGIYSARYAGPGAGRRELCEKILEEMKRVAEGNRAAHFKCSIAMADPGGVIKLEAEGVCRGVITGRMLGGGGFGYDPVFLYPPADKTFAMMSEDEKHSHSHRGAAMKEFRAELEKYLQQKEIENGL